MSAKAPKKKKAGAKGKTVRKPKKDEGATALFKARYADAIKDLDVAKFQLAHKDEIVRVSSSKTEVYQAKYRSISNALTQEKNNKDDIAMEMNRQYLAMQTKLSSDMEHLQLQHERLQEEHTKTCITLEREKNERTRLEAEKLDSEQKLNGRLNLLVKSYNEIIADSYDTLCVEMDKLRQGWQQESLEIDNSIEEAIKHFRTGT